MIPPVVKTDTFQLNKSLMFHLLSSAVIKHALLFSASIISVTEMALLFFSFFRIYKFIVVKVNGLCIKRCWNASFSESNDHLCYLDET